MRQRKTGGGTEVKGEIKYYCDNCAKKLGKGSRQKPSIWCNLRGGVHFNCSGLQRVDDYKKTLDFLCSKCALTRKLVDSTADSLAYSNIHSGYTSCNNPAALAGRNLLNKASNWNYKQVDNYLNRSETYTKFKPEIASLGRSSRVFDRMKFGPLIWPICKNYLVLTTELTSFLSR